MEERRKSLFNDLVEKEKRQGQKSNGYLQKVYKDLFGGDRGEKIQRDMSAISEGGEPSDSSGTPSPEHPKKKAPEAKKGFFNSITGMFKSSKEAGVEDRAEPGRNKALGSSLVLQPVFGEGGGYRDELVDEKRREKGREQGLSKSIARLDSQTSQKTLTSNSSHSRPPEKKSRWSIFGD
jgi:hypothetical protein